MRDELELRTGEALAAHAVGISKIHGQGDTAVRAMDEVTVDLPRERFTAVMGPSGLREVDATALPCRAGPGSPVERCGSATRS